MKQAKLKKSGRKRAATTTVPKGTPTQKAAIRSEAFARAILDAKSYIIDPARLRALFEEASRKVAIIPKEPFKESWPYLQTMLRLIRAYFRGEYRNVSQNELLAIIAAISYLVNPFDLIPDEIPFLGFVDDATVIAFAIGRSRPALDDFMMWETTAF